MTTHDIALLRLVAQRLAGPRCPTPADVVRHLLAVQAQDLPGALMSVALRTPQPSRQAVAAAFDAGEVVRTWPMRGTLHLVPALDVRWMLDLMTARPLAAAERRRSQLGITDEQVVRSGELLAARLAGGDAVSRAEVLALWQDAGIPAAKGHGYHLLAHHATTGLVCFGPMRDGEQLVVLLEEWVREPRLLGRDEALAELALRYVRSHGPATDADLARWSGLGLRDVRAGIAAAGDRLMALEVEGLRYHLDPAVPDILAQHRTDARRAMLLPGFDELVLGYADRTATVPAELAERLVPGGNGVFRNTVVRDGRVVGLWRRVGSGRRRVELEHLAGPALPPEDSERLTADLAAAEGRPG